MVIRIPPILSNFFLCAVWGGVCVWIYPFTECLTFSSVSVTGRKSINTCWSRLCPQVIYLISLCLRLAMIRTLKSDINRSLGSYVCLPLFPCGLFAYNNCKLSPFFSYTLFSSSLCMRLSHNVIKFVIDIYFIFMFLPSCTFK